MITLWLATGLLAAPAAAPPPEPAAQTSGGYSAAYERNARERFKARERYEDNEAAREKLLADAIAAAYDKATGQAREAVLEAAQIEPDQPSRPSKIEFRRAAQSTLRADLAQIAQMRDALNAIALEQQGIAAERNRVRLVRMLDDAIQAAIEQDEEDIEMLLLA